MRVVFTNGYFGIFPRGIIHNMRKKKKSHIFSYEISNMFVFGLCWNRLNLSNYSMFVNNKTIEKKNRMIEMINFDFFMILLIDSVMTDQPPLT